jgi:phage shock protein A
MGNSNSTERRLQAESTQLQAENSQLRARLDQLQTANTQLQATLLGLQTQLNQLQQAEKRTAASERTASLDGGSDGGTAGAVSPDAHGRRSFVLSRPQRRHCARYQAYQVV